MFVITVEFKIKSQALDQFLLHMLNNAKASRETEPGCLRFDVCQEINSPQTIFLYEIYKSKAAFDDHLATSHFKEFDKMASPFIESKSVKALNLISD